MQGGAGRCRAVQGGAGRCRAVQGGAGRCRAVQGGAGRCRAVQGSAGRCRAVQGGAGRCRAVQGGAGRCRAVQGVQVRLVVLGGEVGGSSSTEIVVCGLRFETFQEFQKDVRRVWKKRGAFLGLCRGEGFRHVFLDRTPCGADGLVPSVFEVIRDGGRNS